MPTITDENQLRRVMEEAATRAIDGITKEVKEIFREAYVRRYVYDSHGDNQMYHAGTRTATYEFLESWNWSSLTKTLNTLSTQLWYDPNSVGMHNDIETFLHGSRYSSPVSVIYDMPAILEGKRSRLWLSVDRPIKFWEQFISDMLDRGDMEKIVTNHFLAQGFVKV